MNDNNQDNIPEYQLSYQPMNLQSIFMALLIPAVIGYFLIVLITSLFTFVSRELWSISVIWPEILHLGGLVGGILGGIIALAEVSLYHYKNRKISPGEMIPSDLYYIGVLALFTYVLEFFSESIILQIILFLLELGFFLVLGWNISKLSLEIRIRAEEETSSSTGITSRKESLTENKETE